MNEQEKAISQLCIAMQGYCNDLRVDNNLLDDSYNLGCIELCIEKIHRMVNPNFNKLCEAFEEVMEDNMKTQERNHDDEEGND